MVTWEFELGSSSNTPTTAPSWSFFGPKELQGGPRWPAWLLKMPLDLRQHWGSSFHPMPMGGGLPSIMISKELSGLRSWGDAEKVEFKLLTRKQKKGGKIRREGKSGSWENRARKTVGQLSGLVIWPRSQIVGVRTRAGLNNPSLQF